VRECFLKQTERSMSSEGRRRNGVIWERGRNWVNGVEKREGC
jgi:hypothetical protein